MTATELRSLPTREKFEILDILWSDLAPEFEEAPVSPEIKKLLDDRLDRIERGETKFYDWDEIKDQLGKR